MGKSVAQVFVRDHEMVRIKSLATKRDSSVSSVIGQFVRNSLDSDTALPEIETRDQLVDHLVEHDLCPDTPSANMVIDYAKNFFARQLMGA